MFFLLRLKSIRKCGREKWGTRAGVPWGEMGKDLIGVVWLNDTGNPDVIEANEYYELID